MQTSHAKTIRGLSIAVVVLSVLGILGLILCLVFMGVSGAALSNSDIRDSVSLSIEMDSDTMQSMEELGMTADDALGLIAVLFGLGSIYFVWGIICSVIALVAGIIGMRNYNNVAKLGGVFGWAIAGAVMAFLYGNIVTMVLLIISAVCASKDRKAATAIPYGQPVAYYGAPQPYGAPQQPYGAPQKPPQHASPQQPRAAPDQPQLLQQPDNSTEKDGQQQ